MTHHTTEATPAMEEEMKKHGVLVKERDELGRVDFDLFETGRKMHGYRRERGKGLMGIASGGAERLCVGEEGERERGRGRRRRKARSNPFNNPRTGRPSPPASMPPPPEFKHSRLKRRFKPHSLNAHHHDLDSRVITIQ